MKKVKIYTGGQIVKIKIELNQNEFALALENGALQALHEALRTENYETIQEQVQAAHQIPQVETASKDQTQNEDKPPWEDEPKDEKQYTEVEIRAKFVELSKKGKKADLKNILSSLGVQKVSDIKPEQYQEAMAKLEAL